MKRWIAFALVWAPALAAAQRPVLAGEATHGTANVLVHYATTGADAPPPGDTTADGVPDFVAEVATEAQAGLDKFAQLGFAPPLADTLGGDARVDIYLRDLVSADGNAGTDSCAANTCIGYAVAENDFSGYAYSSVSEGIRSVVPHEVFHLVQYAYAMNQPATWTEGTAVWAVEVLYGDRNRDFERFIPSFLSKTFRPYERGAGGFGDSYPYGAALWPYYLSQRFGPEVVVDAWEAARTANALDATHSALVAHGSSFDAAWTDFTRANADATPKPPREPVDAARIYIEGLSARYVPLEVTVPSSFVLTTTSRIAAAIDGVALEDDTVIAPGSHLLVITGLSRNTIATAVDIARIDPVPEDDDDDGGCSSTRQSSFVVALVLLALLVVLTPRRTSR